MWRFLLQGFSYFNAKLSIKTTSSLPNIMLPGHRCCILGLALPKTIVIGFKKYKHPIPD